MFYLSIFIHSFISFHQLEPRRGKRALVKTGFRYGLSCLNDTSQNLIRNDFISVFEYLRDNRKLGQCGQSDHAQCSFKNVQVEVQCGKTQRRNRRQAIDGSGGIDVVEITFTLVVEITVMLFSIWLYPVKGFTFVLIGSKTK